MTVLAASFVVRVGVASGCVSVEAWLRAASPWRSVAPSFPHALSPDKPTMHDKNKRFLIGCPPPTISGNLHMGHVFSYAQMDFIARYHRHIKGEYLVYPYCYDNNGLPTEK